MAKKKKKIQKIVKTKELFFEQQMTIQDLTEEIKFNIPEKASKFEISNKKAKLKRLMQKVESYEKNIAKLDKKIRETPNYYDKLKLELEIEEQKEFIKKIDISSQRNEIRKMEGKDFYYQFDTGFKVHKILSSEVHKQEDNSLFLKLYKQDVKNAIKELRQSKDPSRGAKIKVLKERLLPVIDFNLDIDAVRESDINRLKKQKQQDIKLAANPDIPKEDKGGKYAIQIILTGELIQIQ